MDDKNSYGLRDVKVKVLRRSLSLSELESASKRKRLDEGKEICDGQSTKKISQDGGVDIKDKTAGVRQSFQRELVERDLAMLTLEDNSESSKSSSCDNEVNMIMSQNGSGDNAHQQCIKAGPSREFNHMATAFQMRKRGAIPIDGHCKHSFEGDDEMEDEDDSAEEPNGSGDARW